MNRRGFVASFPKIISKIVFTIIFLLMIYGAVTRAADLSQFYKEYYAEDLALTLDTLSTVPGNAKATYHASYTKKPLYFDINKERVAVGAQEAYSEQNAILYPRIQDTNLKEKPSQLKPPWINIQKNQEEITITETGSTQCPSTIKFTEETTLLIKAPEDQRTKEAIETLIQNEIGTAILVDNEPADFTIEIIRTNTQTPKLTINEENSVTERFICNLRNQLPTLGKLELNTEQTNSESNTVQIELPTGYALETNFAYKIVLAYRGMK